MNSLTVAQSIMADAARGIADGRKVEVFSTRKGTSIALAFLTVTASALGSGQAMASAAGDGRVVVREAREVVRDSRVVTRDVQRIQRAAERNDLGSILGSVGSVLGIAEGYEKAARKKLGSPAEAQPSGRTSPGGGYRNQDEFLQDFGSR